MDYVNYLVGRKKRAYPHLVIHLKNEKGGGRRPENGLTDTRMTKEQTNMGPNYYT